MLGSELIQWIQDHHAEDYQIVVIGEDGEKDYLGCGLDDPDDIEKIIYI